MAYIRQHHPWGKSHHFSIYKTGIKPLTGTAADKTELTLDPTAFILLGKSTGYNSGYTR